MRETQELIDEISRMLVQFKVIAREHGLAERVHRTSKAIDQINARLAALTAKLTSAT